MHAPDPADDGTDRSPTEAEEPADEDSMVVFEFAVPTEQFVLSRPLREFPDVSVEFERLVPTKRTTMPYLWATDGDTPAFGEAVAADPAVERIRTVATLDGGALYGLEWDPADDEFFHRCETAREGTALLQARATADEWRLKFRFPSRDALADFQSFYGTRDLDVRVVSLYDLTEPKLAQYDITEKQRDALLLATAMGHFEIPREATLEDVADELGISARSLSERLRRGRASLVRNTLTVGRPTGVGIDEE